VAALVANPGPDGISLQEAVMATNSDPGTWNIQFAPALKGSTIRFAYWPRGANRLIVFMPYHPDVRVAASLPGDDGKGFLLDQLLRIRDVVHLRIVVFAYDSFSDARRAFISKDYTQDDLASGKYVADSLHIAPRETASVHDDEAAD
jgi:hypothetical protein